VPYGDVERRFADATAAIERAAHGVALAALDMDCERVRIGGDLYRRVGRHPQTYKTPAGPVEVMRSIFRQVGVRNAKTVDPLVLRTGALDDGWLPHTARAMSLLMAQGTSREAEATGRELGRLPYSRCSFERVAHTVGETYVALQDDIQADLRDELEVPASARSVSLSLDRVSVPMEEPRARPVGRPRRRAPKRPCERVFRMAWCASLTLHDADGEALASLRYGCMPAGDVEGLCANLVADLRALLAARPRLKVILLADGAPELWTLLEKALASQEVKQGAHRLIDAWHLLEKLGAAARVLHGDADDAGARVRAWYLRLLNSSSAARRILAELRASGREHVLVGESRPVHDAITYLENNHERMDYAAARRRGLPIGSGAVEATCKSLMGQRLKRPGARWHEETGEHIVQLRAQVLSGRWERAIALTLEPFATPVRRAA
jgi:hypothetical protein